MSAMLTDYADGLIAHLAIGLRADDREPFRLAATNALAAMPPAMLGPGSVYRAVEGVWRRFFRPVDTAREPQTELRARRPKNDPRMKSVPFEGV